MVPQSGNVSSNSLPISGFDSESAIASEQGIGGRSALGFALAAFVALTAMEVLVHQFFPHLDPWKYQAMAVFTGTVSTSICGYYLTRKIGMLFAGRIQMEKRLAFERNLLRTVVDNIPDSILAKDAEGRYVLVNKAFAKLHDLEEPEQLLGKTAFDLFPKEKAAALHAADLEVMRATKPLLQDERSMIDAEGNTKWILMSKVPLTNQQGDIVGIVGVNRDITQEKRSKTELHNAKEAAEAANRAKSEFLANMSHEIRTPMNGIIGMTELAIDTELTPEQQEYLNMVKSSADSLLTVINDILDFSKMEAGKLELEHAEFNLHEIMEETVRAFSVRASEKGLELVCDIPAAVPQVVVGDPTRLRQIIVNLLGNAIKFTDSGEVILRVETKQADGRNVALHFAIQDTGIGIADEKQKLIFDAFAQADSSPSRNHGGTGLGLTISSKLVDLMGGRIWLESRYGHGSAFHFTLTLDFPQTRIAGQERQEIVLAGVPVLIVDDNPTNRRILEGTLLQWGMKPILAESGSAALQKLKQARDAGKRNLLLLIDAQMPGMDGFSLMEKIRQDPNLPTSTVMMLTSGGQRGDAARCQELGISAYLTKPVRQWELREAILRVLGLGQERTDHANLLTRHSLSKARRQLRVLLAEDNAVNRELVVRLLSKRGHSVVVAWNGKQAASALESQSFDLVLMDVQMPEMDGFEATALIREKEKITGTHIPIIALTAHAMKGDRERCLAAGMDGYVSKPVQAEELIKAVEGLGEDLLAASKSSDPTNQIVDREVALARVGGDEGLLADLALLFCQESPRLLFAVEDAVTRKDVPALKRSIHSLKGSLSTFVAKEATEAALKLDELARSGDLAGAQDAYRLLATRVERLKQVLERLGSGRPELCSERPLPGEPVEISSREKS